MKFNFKIKPNSSDVKILLIDGKLSLNGSASDFRSQIDKYLKVNPSFTGKFGQSTSIFDEKSSSLLILFGIGDIEKLTLLNGLSLGGKINNILNTLKIKSADLIIGDELSGAGIDIHHFISQILLGASLKNYSFNKYFIDKKKDHQLYLEDLTLVHKDIEKIKDLFLQEEKLASGVFLTRDLVSEPPNVLYPETFAEECKKLESLGVKVTVLDQAELKKQKMNALLGVSQGSQRAPRVVVMEWHGDKDNADKSPLVVVGKGVTFDSGGINIKPSANMGEMKCDMGGAGVVTGLMHAIAARKAKANVVGAVGLVENMPSGTAQRPSDIVVSMSGQSIEVDNTDAEGRLVLADVLWYVQENYRPKAIIDLATLTGAMVVALGDGYAGLFANDDELAEKLLIASRNTGELIWRMPLGDHYDRQINSEIADIKNTGTGGGAGSITAAQFLKRFIQDGVKWAHIDIAGVTWNKKGNDIMPKGATGFGVRLLNDFIKNFASFAS